MYPVQVNHAIDRRSTEICARVRHRNQVNRRAELNHAGEACARGHRPLQSHLPSHRDAGCGCDDGDDDARPHMRIRTRSCCRRPMARDRGGSGGRRIRPTRTRRRQRSGSWCSLCPWENKR